MHMDDHATFSYYNTNDFRKTNASLLLLIVVILIVCLCG
jgi:hypothetical protein